MLQLLTPAPWPDYQLLDSGNFQKLERFGSYILQRPEPQAVWQPSLTQAAWQQQATARFEQQGSHQGTWHKQLGMPESWQLNYPGAGYQLSFRLALTAFKHVGIFPEQAANWDFIFQQCRQIPRAQVLNLFAYTGGATLAAAAAGAEVVHVDAIKQVVSWAKNNLELSGLQGVRWIVEDAFKFVQREVRRGSKYQGIILDPPAFGHGAQGERWRLEDQIDGLVALLAQLQASGPGFLVFNCYSLGFSALILQRLVAWHYRQRNQSLQVGELYLQEPSGAKLPCGVVVRWAA